MNVKNPHIIWGSVAIVFMLIAGSVTLVALGKDFSSVLTIAAVAALPVLAGFGATIYQKVDQVKEIANGNNAALRHDLSKSHQQSVELAKQIQPAPEEGPDAGVGS